MEPPSSPDVSVLNQSGLSVDPSPILRAVTAVLNLHGATEASATVLLTRDEHIRQLNCEFRSLDEPTDVLTFPDDPFGSGDIAIAIPYAEKQAQLRGVSLDQEVAYLAIHGALHLVGLDDQTEPERAQMLCEMNRIARDLDLPEDHSWGSLLHEEERV